MEMVTRLLRRTKPPALRLLPRRPTQRQLAPQAYVEAPRISLSRRSNPASNALLIALVIFSEGSRQVVFLTLDYEPCHDERHGEEQEQSPNGVSHQCDSGVHQ